MSNSDALKSNSRKDFLIGEENINDAIQEVEGVQEVKGVEETSCNDDGVQQSNNKKKARCARTFLFLGTLH